MFPLGDIWDALGGGALTALIGGLSYAYVRVFKARHEVARDDRDAVIDSQKKYIATQGRREEHLQNLYDDLVKANRLMDSKERRCQRRVDRLRLVVQAIAQRVLSYEEAVKSTGLPVMPRTKLEEEIMKQEDDLDDEYVDGENPPPREMVK